MYSDSIADMLTRVRNAYAVRKPTVVLPYSKFKLNLANVLVSEGLLAAAEKTERTDKPNFSELTLALKYGRSGKPAITAVKKISKPGRRVYVAAADLPYVLNGFGIAVISTSQGLMTNKQARKVKVGGEVICEIY
ncbi:30S ribosomal protein S8 [Candidatus Falkowbacteria bacterium RIFOXYC2_FULL_47_12]|uniref:Small ribosomal subunit protein uS8 n=2 Tax=Candidatus Falkowiibacteriota TaxID=1752728 RepID=A0A1F5TMW8_9BACT|nr:MAG: 30S ribosomal protein S8 [Candidatus Falkowbacteria bacterium RIFOXYA2_FULL_47_9]OGF40293.1 MAG: 30S ribosomal protein S8 [Candidatus Falkowbacteria bacterium RIFOXYC2_FULL_47_12]